MIKRTHAGTMYRPNSDLANHAVVVFGFLLPLQQWTAWTEFATLIRRYSIHPKAQALASEIEKFDKEIEKFDKEIANVRHA